MLLAVIIGVLCVAVSRHTDKIDLHVATGAVCVLLVIRVLYSVIKNEKNRFKMHLLSSDGMNETLIIEGWICERSSMFLVDTGYAGPPVLSTSYLAIEENPLLTAVGSVQTRYPKIIKALTKNVTASARDAAIESLLRQRQCLAFTSGCTMRLMSIGATEEQQADMLLCPSIMLATCRRVRCANTTHR